MEFVDKFLNMMVKKEILKESLMIYVIGEIEEYVVGGIVVGEMEDIFGLDEIGLIFDIILM